MAKAQETAADTAEEPTGGTGEVTGKGRGASPCS